MKNLDQAFLLVDLIIDEDRGVDQPADSRSHSNRIPHAGEPAKQIDVIKQGLAKKGGNLGVVSGDLLHDLGQIG
jgi:hypothetical protein